MSENLRFYTNHEWVLKSWIKKASILNTQTKSILNTKKKQFENINKKHFKHTNKKQFERSFNLMFMFLKDAFQSHLILCCIFAQSKDHIYTSI
jgi:hypothetical protein